MLNVKINTLGKVINGSQSQKHAIDLCIFLKPIVSVLVSKYSFKNLSYKAIMNVFKRSNELFNAFIMIWIEMQINLEKLFFYFL